MARLKSKFLLTNADYPAEGGYPVIVLTPRELLEAGQSYRVELTDYFGDTYQVAQFQVVDAIDETAPQAPSLNAIALERADSSHCTYRSASVCRHSLAPEALSMLEVGWYSSKRIENSDDFMVARLVSSSWCYGALMSPHP